MRTLNIYTPLLGNLSEVMVAELVLKTTLTKAVNFLWGFCSTKVVEPAEAGIPLAPAVQGGGQTPRVNRLFSQELRKLLVLSQRQVTTEQIPAAKAPRFQNGECALQGAFPPAQVGRLGPLCERRRGFVGPRTAAGWAGRGAGPVPPPRAPTCPPDLEAQSRGIAQLSLPVRPRRRSRPGRCPPPHARPGCLRWRGRATPRDSRHPPPPEVRRPRPDGAGGQRPGPEPQQLPQNSFSGNGFFQNGKNNEMRSLSFLSPI